LDQNKPLNRYWIYFPVLGLGLWLGLGLGLFFYCRSVTHFLLLFISAAQIEPPRIKSFHFLWKIMVTVINQIVMQNC